jgi:hypothetical protein
MATFSSAYSPQTFPTRGKRTSQAVPSLKATFWPTFYAPWRKPPSIWQWSWLGWKVDIHSGRSFVRAWFTFFNWGPGTRKFGEKSRIFAL